MVLGSCVSSFAEICPTSYGLLHSSYRKLCHLLTDLDEWAQVLTVEVLMRYCRVHFVRPPIGRAEVIDGERRRRRGETTPEDSPPQIQQEQHQQHHQQQQPTTLPREKRKKKVTRRVVRKAFYSDESDESSVEEVWVDSEGEDISSNNNNTKITIDDSSNPSMAFIPTLQSSSSDTLDSDETLDPDHQLLLRSSLPLLKARNSAVVMAVCSLHYHCGVSSMSTRQAIGKSLVRIHRDKREIQFVVLQAIRDLALPAPSMFSPFLKEFFVKASDTPAVRIIKMEILTHLAMNRESIDQVLKECKVSKIFNFFRPFFTPLHALR